MASEKVGPGHPPREHRFKPGQAGNPRGRPPRARNLATILFNQLNEKVPFEGRKITRLESMLRAQVEAAVACHPRAVRQIVELWLSYHSDLPDRVDYQFEHKVVVGTYSKLEELSQVQRAEDSKRERKAAKSARNKKARAERARKKRLEAKAARKEAATKAEWATRAAAMRPAPADHASSPTTREQNVSSPTSDYH